MECNWSAAVLNHQQLDRRRTTSFIPNQRTGKQSIHRRPSVLDCLPPPPQQQTRPLLHPTVINSNGPRWNASHRPNGVKIEFLQQQYTSPPFAKKRRKCTRLDRGRKLDTT